MSPDLETPPTDPDEIADALADVIAQACQQRDGTIDSGGLSAYAYGIRVLAGLGRVDLHVDAGRRVIARWRHDPMAPPRPPYGDAQ